uniref:Uncharacterized protein n=1 Tax=Roseihalotalea indica TaxID=2867963 RepID=A0AA49GKE5_9BACT|nr:hypothetical protein K4G66_26305 [Tunicatimonas sp. TK19036]
MDKLQYCKNILEKVSFDKELLRKEYEKALKLLSGEEADALGLWYNEKFRNNHGQQSDNSKKK